MALPSRDLPATPYQAGDIIAGKYRLDRLLGQGGMGAVWAAFNLQLEAEVAIKVLVREHASQELLAQRLKQEAKAAAKLGHPGIVRVFDVGESERGDPFIVMELLKGRSLATLLSEDGVQTSARAVQLLLPIADALSVAHAKGIIHRDLKPDNVFISLEDEQIQPKLVDFGIVKLADRDSQTHLTQVGMVLGSPDYMSPEQARGLEDVDHRSDIWSFCVVLYELISGTTPFTATNYNALLRTIVEDEPRPLATRTTEEEELWHILRRGLEKARDQRFRSMSELGRALASWLIRQNIVEDVCGGSLDAKWILRASDPTALRAARASLSSFPSLPPESGVRPTHDIGTAATLGAKAVALTPSESIAPLVPAKRSSFRRAAPVLAAAVAAALVTLLSLLALRDHSAPAARAPATAPAPVAAAEAARAAAPSLVSEPAPVAAAESAAPAIPAATPARPPSTSVRRARPAGAASEESAKGASSDLLSPY
ncbi:MAG TPA: serine/threonine-protein kinase [Polyangiaceae bacterium]|jgi:serine/threonine-protein kinase|nr:serine/threonine-protein kinase [Polyangiaceae bacterium]